MLRGGAQQQLWGPGDSLGLPQGSALRQNWAEEKVKVLPKAPWGPELFTGLLSSPCEGGMSTLTLRGEEMEAPRGQSQDSTRLS